MAPRQLLDSSWWDTINNSTSWQDGVYFALCSAYALVGAAALIQLIRIELRVPEYGWTTQKVFHLMNFIVNAARAAVFGFHAKVFTFTPMIFRIVFLDLPGLLFFSTYSLLVLFWAEIYHQICTWIYEWLSPNNVIFAVARIFFAVVSFCAALGFLIYGGRLFLVLRRFPIESKGRQKKLWEVGCVTAVCFTCFTVRTVVVAWSAFDNAANVDVLNHPILNLFYYMFVEIIPSALVLFILRKLPPKALSGQYHPIR